MMGRLASYRMFLFSGAAVVGWIILWAWLTREGGPVPTLYFPPPEDVLNRFWRMWTRPYIGSTLFEHILSSLYIVLTGWSAAAIVGVPLGIAMAWWSKLKWIIFPIFHPPGATACLDTADHSLAGNWRRCPHVSRVHRSPGALADELDACRLYRRQALD